MIYRKFKGRALFTGSQLFESGEVLVTDEAGTVIEIVGAETVSDAEALDGIICPGFVNAHCHLELSWMKGIVPKLSGMIDFLLAVMKAQPAEEMALNAAIEEAENEMLQNGIIAVGDVCNTALTLPQKLKGNIYYHNFIEAMGFVEAAADERFNRAVKVFNEFAQHYPIPLACNSVVPHSPYSVSKSLFDKIIRFSGNHLLTIHNQEHAAENEFFMSGTGEFHRLYKAIGIDSSFHKGTGLSSVQHFLPWFRRNQSLILVHNTQTSAEDLRFIDEMAVRGITTWLCLCANANLYINASLPDINAISGYNDRVVIGTDSLASNEALSMVSEINTIHKHFPSISISRLLQWATLNGARALEIDNEAGSFEAGKQPGIVLITGVDEAGNWDKAKSFRML